MRFQTGNIISGLWTLEKQISESSDYQIFHANSNYNIHVVLKITKNRVTRYAPHMYTLNSEFSNLRAIHEFAESIMGLSLNQIPIVKPISFIPHSNHPIMVLKPLKRSINVFLQEHSLKYRITSLVGFFMIKALELTHRAGYVHMDVNPSHMIAQVGKGSVKFFLGGFRHAVRFVDQTSIFALPYTQSNQRSGDVLFSSVNAMSSFTCGPRDDLESLGYCLIYMVRRRLPWSGMDEVKQKNLIIKLKDPGYRKQLCRGLGVMERYFAIVDRIERKRMPKYDDLRAIFREYIEVLGGIDHAFDFRPPTNPMEGVFKQG